MEVARVNLTEEERHSLVRKREFWFRGLWLSIGVAVIPPLVGVILGMTLFVKHAGDFDPKGEVDVVEMTGNVPRSLTRIKVGLFIAPIGIIGAIICYCGFRKTVRELESAGGRLGWGYDFEGAPTQKSDEVFFGAGQENKPDAKSD